MPLGNLINQIKAYVVATDSLRTEEINPLSQQYVSELLVSSTTLSNATYYYPSTAGMAIAGFKDVSFDFYLLGNNAGPTTVTMTIEGTSDDVTPYWHDSITPAGFELVTNATGAASFISPSGAVVSHGILDFDEYNGKLIRVKIVVSAANNCTARIYARRKA